jgi:putative transcriptional regulator
MEWPHSNHFYVLLSSQRKLHAKTAKTILISYHGYRKLLDNCAHICYSIFSMVNFDKFTDKLKYCRLRKALTQEQLARNIGVSLNTVQRWESGKTHPSPLAMEKLEALLKDVLTHDQMKLF